MKKEFILLEPKKFAALTNTFEFIKNISWVISIGLFVVAMRMLKDHRYQEFREHPIFIYFLFFCSAILAFFSVYDFIRKTFFKGIEKPKNPCGTIELTDTYLAYQYTDSTLVMHNYDTIDRIDVYFYYGLKPASDRRENAFKTISAIHIRLFKDEHFENLFVFNKAKDETTMGGLFTMLEKLQMLDDVMYRKIQFWSKFKDS